MTSLRQTCKLFGRARQRGQAMVEFAIIALLLILLIAGGVELGIAAFNSNRTAEGAKAATNEWMQHISRENVECIQISIDPDNPVPDKGCSTPDVNYFRSFKLTSSTGLGDHGLGDHDTLSNFARPSCLPVNITDGLPDYADGFPEDGNVYLYNPLPIDITECFGNDELEPSRSRVSVLLTGHSAAFENDPEYYPGLPKIHQAIYSQYETVCLSPDGYISCSSDEYLDNIGLPGYSKLLKLPGWLDLEDDYAMSMLPRIREQNVGGQTKFVLDPDVSPNPKPTFAIQCRAINDPQNSNSFEGCDSRVVPNDICWHDNNTPTPTPLACDVRIEMRYRYTFETFIGMTMAEKGSSPMTPVDTDALEYFDAIEPGRVGSDLQRGTYVCKEPFGVCKEDELELTGAPPKPFRDFLGCYETSAYPTGAASEKYLTSFNTISCN